MSQTATPIVPALACSIVATGEAGKAVLQWGDGEYCVRLEHPTTYVDVKPEELVITGREKVADS